MKNSKIHPKLVISKESFVGAVMVMLPMGIVAQAVAQPSDGKLYESIKYGTIS